MFDHVLQGEPVTSGGQKTVTGFTSRVVTLVVNVTELPVGSPTLTFSLTEVDPGDGKTSLGNAVFSDPIVDRQLVTLTLTNVQSSAVIVRWLVTGDGSFPNVSATVNEKDPNTLGQQSAANSTSVVLASDQAPIAVTGSISATNPSVGLDGEAGPTSSTQVGGQDGAGFMQHVQVLNEDPSGTEQALVVRNIPSGVQAISAASLPLPTGAATEATLAGITTPADTQPVSAASLPLPVGASTEATLATRLADATVTARLGVLGQADMASSAPVVLASDQSSIPVTGPLTDVQLRATPVPVSGAFFQATQPVSAASLPLPTGAATEATLAAASAKLPTTLGQKAMAASLTVAIASDQGAVPISGSVTTTDASIGANNAAAPGSSTQVGGIDGTGNLQAAAVDGNGVLVVAQLAYALATARLTGSVGRFVGETASAATNIEAVVRNTAYTEQAANAQRSVNSTSANDTAAAGVGARTVRITYYSVSAGVVTGPFIEDVILNGTTAVNTVSSAIAFIESLEVLTGGAGGTYPVGAVQIFTTTAGGGSVFGSIAAGARRTMWCHHYVASGRRAFITDLTSYSTAATAQQPDFHLRSVDLGTTNAIERRVSDHLMQQGSSDSTCRTLQTPLVVTGPARVTGYVTTTNGAAQLNAMEVGYYEL